MQSEAVQDYVKQIYLLQTSSGKATTSEIAERMGVLAEDMGVVTDLLGPGHIDVYGTRPEQALAMDRPLEDSGLPFMVKTRFVGGFTRGRDE